TLNSAAARRARAVGHHAPGSAKAAMPAMATGVCDSTSHRVYWRRLMAMLCAENSAWASPYPDANGDPYKRALSTPTNTHAGRNVSTEARTCDGVRVCCVTISFQKRMMMASGARLVRMSSAAPIARPQQTASRFDSPSAKYTAAAQHAAAGTSLIGETSMAMTTGLVATNQAAINPVSGDPRRTPIANVIQTSTKPVSGVTQNIPACPNTAFASAIISGRPGAVTGTIAASFVAGLKPCGLKVQTASGHGAEAATGTGVFRLE